MLNYKKVISKEESDPSKKPPKLWWNSMEKEVKSGNPDYSADQVAKTIGKIWSDLSEDKKEEVRDREGKKYGIKEESSKKQAAEMVDLFQEKYRRWIMLEVQLLASNNFGPWGSIEEADQKVDQGIDAVVEVLTKAIRPEVERLVADKRKGILEDMVTSIKLPEAGIPSTAPEGPKEPAELPEGISEAPPVEAMSPLPASKKKTADRIPPLDARKIELKNYGSGKFSNSLDEWLYENSLQGSDADLGDVQGFGWYGLLLFDSPISVHDVSNDLNWDFSAAILNEDSQGFINVDTFDTHEDAVEVWEELEKEYANFEGEGLDEFEEGLGLDEFEEGLGKGD